MARDAATPDSGNPFDVYVSDAPHCLIPPKPAAVPEGWEPYTDYDPCCMMYVPSAPQYLPPPLKWTACNTAWNGDGGVDAGECRQIDQPSAGSPEFGASVRDGVVTLLTNELINGVYAAVVADADGPVHQAFMLDSAALCGPSPSDMRDGKYVYQIYNTSGFTGGGFIAGDVNEFRPSFVHHFNDALTHGVVAGKLGVLDVDETDTFNLYEWSANPKIVRNPQDDGLDYSFALFSADALFWLASAGPYHRIGAYTDDGGATDLVSFGADGSHGAADLGADGVDMMWMEGSGHTGDPIAFDTAQLMTSPFATDPAKVVARRLRSESPDSIGVTTTKVGCGYGARTNGNYLRIVRLSDGVSWVLNNSGSSWKWINTLVVTCDEVFVTVGLPLPNGSNIARVRISSLGPGIPPD